MITHEQIADAAMAILANVTTPILTCDLADLILLDDGMFVSRRELIRVLTSMADGVLSPYATSEETDKPGHRRWTWHAQIVSRRIPDTIVNDKPDRIGEILERLTRIEALLGASPHAGA